MFNPLNSRYVFSLFCVPDFYEISLMTNHSIISVFWWGLLLPCHCNCWPSRDDVHAVTCFIYVTLLKLYVVCRFTEL